MCGIVGFSGSFPPELLTEMNQTIAHRGPDDQGLYLCSKEGIGLGHRRLSIIDLSPLGHQPMWDTQKQVAIVYNGEIYNYKELRKDLEAKGFSFRSQSDTEVLLNLYLDCGEKMLTKLNGIFAFSLWDPREQQILLARDGQGTKPLYYTQTSQGLLWASELKALLRCSDVDTSLNYASIHYHFTYQWSPAPDTILQAVKKLEPGHAMIVRRGEIKKKWSYYDLPYHQPVGSMTEKEAVSGLEEHVMQAVNRQLVSDVPVGAFLSGGLDSSAVIAMAQKADYDPKRLCFTIGFKGNANPRGEGRIDDLPYAKRTADYLNVDLRTIYVGPEMFGQVEHMIYHLDEPQADFAPIHVYFICKLARENGIKVLLSGAGGDDILTGYRRHTALAFEKYWDWLPKPARSFLRSASRRLPTSHTLGRRVAKAFQYADLSDDQRIASYFHSLEPHWIKSLYTPKIQDKLSGLPFSHPLMNTLSHLPEHVPPINRMLYLEGKHFLPDHNLNYTDKMSMATGVEVRVPLLDPDLIQFATQIPVSYKQRGTTGKWVFKKAMEPYLPSDIIYRPKTGFGVPIRRWLKFELRDLVEDTLSETKLRDRGLFEPSAVRRIIDLDRQGRIDGSLLIFSMITLELWMKIFLDRQTSLFT